MYFLSLSSRLLVDCSFGFVTEILMHLFKTKRDGIGFLALVCDIILSYYRHNTTAQT
jgi:hypothetical protein